MYIKTLLVRPVQIQLTWNNTCSFKMLNMLHYLFIAYQIKSGRDIRYAQNYIVNNTSS